MASNLVAKPSVQARTRKRLAPSGIRGPLVFLGRGIIYPYLRYVLKFRKIKIANPEIVVDAFEEFQAGRTRLTLAFRHPYGDEPQLFFHVFENLVPRYARRLKRPLKHKPAVRPVHDFAVALWGDAVIRYILPRVGAVPVYHVKYDSASVRGIRNVMKDGASPLSIAPEGQISYHAETLPRIEQGTVRMGFWCANDLAKSGRDEHVKVLPLSVHYQFNRRDMGKVLKMLSRLEKTCGLSPETTVKAEATPVMLFPRLDRIENKLLELTEQYYTDTYAYQPPEQATRHERWLNMQPFALSVAEHMFGMDAENDDVIRRMYRVRQEAWDRIYPEKPVEGNTPLAAAFADRRTGEAWYAMRHMELVDLTEYHDDEYFSADVPESLTFDRLVESVYTLSDLAYRLMGGNITNRPNSIRKNVVIFAGKAIDLTDSLPDYRENARQAVQTMTDLLAVNFENCIKEYHNGKSDWNNK